MLHYTAFDLSAWSREGCKTLPRDNSGTVTCKCTHLTNFALLLDDDLSETTTQLKELDQVGKLMFSSCLVRFKRRSLVERKHRRNLYKTFGGLPGRILNVLCMSNLDHVSGGIWSKTEFKKKFDYFCTQF